jgi:hypothetical protein
MKGQAQAVTAVMITGVVVGSIATAYSWGVPLLEKQQSQANIDRTEQNIIGLYEQIVEVSESGEGTTARYNLGEGVSAESMRISVAPEKNYIDVRIEGQNPPYPMDTWTLIRGSSSQNLSIGTGAYGIEGTNIPGAVAVRPVGRPDGSLITYRVEFRNLRAETPTGQQLSKINLSAADSTEAGESTSTIFLSNEGTSWERGSQAVTLPSGEKIPRQNTEISVGFR